MIAISDEQVVTFQRSYKNSLCAVPFLGLVAGGTLRADKVADEITYEYTVESDNDNGRTLKKFSTDANTRMRPGDDTSKAYFTDFQKFVNYYNAFDYADKIISAGFDGTNTNLANGDVNLQSAGTGFDGRLGKYSGWLLLNTKVEWKDGLTVCNTCRNHQEGNCLLVGRHVRDP